MINNTATPYFSRLPISYQEYLIFTDEIIEPAHEG